MNPEETKITFLQSSQIRLERLELPEILTGTGRNFYDVTVASLCTFLHETVPTSDSFDTAYQLSRLLDHQKGLCPLSEAAPWAQKLYAKWMENSGEGSPLDIKKTLPALLPSVRYTAPLPREGKSPRSMVRETTSFWRHTGVFGLDIDCPKEATASERKAMLDSVYAYFKSMPGYLFGYVSPSGGFKGYLQVDDEATDMLNVEDLENDRRGALLRQARHAAIFSHLNDGVLKATGYSLDPSTRDISRIQFLYHGQYLPPTEPTESAYSVPFLATLMTKADADTVDPVADDELLTSEEEVPILIQEFPQWLRAHGYAEAADGVEALRWKGTAKVGFCPQCKDVATGKLSPSDLRLSIVRDFPSQSWFHCLHAHCQNKDSGVESMNKLFRKYVADLDSRPFTMELSAVTSASSLLHRVYYPDKEIAKVLDEKGPLTSTQAYYIEKSDNWQKFDFPSKTPKGQVILNPLNIQYLFKQLHIKVVTDVSSDIKVILDLTKGKISPLSDDFVNHLAYHWDMQISNGSSPLAQIQRTLSAILQSLATTEFYHPLAASIGCKPWDHVDRVTPYINTLELNEDKAPEGWKASDWLNFVLRTWLYTIINHLETSLDNAQAICTSYCPILIGDQGCGKSSWAARLLKEYPGCFSGNFDLKHDKDSLVQKSSTLVIQLDEIDRYLTTADDANLVKKALDLTPAKTRAAYRKDQTNYQPKAVFIGTSNDESPLTDESGNRRYTVLHVQAMNNSLAESRKVRDSIDMQQLWAQVYEEYHTMTSTIEEQVDIVVKASEETNKKYGMRESAEILFVDKLRPVNWTKDTDKEGKPLWKRIPTTYRAPKLLLQILMTIQQNQGAITEEPDTRIRVGQQAAIGLRQAISDTFGSEYAIPKQAVDKTNARRMRVMLVEDWIKYASDETKERWYNKFPEWREQDEQKTDTII